MAVAEVETELPSVGTSRDQAGEIGNPEALVAVAPTSNPTKRQAKWQTVIGADLDDRVHGQAGKKHVIGRQERTHGLAHLLGKGVEIGA